MSKNLKIALIAAALTVAMAFTAMAATYNWKDGYCYDRNGDVYEDTWVKSGSTWYYAESEGELKTDELFEDGDYLYYVDENGAMVVSQWALIYDEDEETEDYYYFDAKGHAVCGVEKPYAVPGWGKYCFGEDGKMLYGWVATAANGDDTVLVKVEDSVAAPYEDALYYCGDEEDGQVATGWQLLDIGDTFGTEKWFYFDPSTTTTKYGKKFADFQNKKVVDTTYGTGYYCFDETGIMLADMWVESATGSYNYYGVDGASKYTGWFQAPRYSTVGLETEESSLVDDVKTKWYYAKNGVVEKAKLLTWEGGKYYLGTDGEMQTGLYSLEVAETGITYANLDSVTNMHDDFNDLGTYVYFGDDGALATGETTVKIKAKAADSDKSSYDFYFAKTGIAKYTGITKKEGNFYYVAGKKVKASSTNEYEVFAVEVDGNGKQTVSTTALKANEIYAAQATTKDSYDKSDYMFKYIGSKYYFTVGGTNYAAKSNYAAYKLGRPDGKYVAEDGEVNATVQSTKANGIYFVVLDKTGATCTTTKTDANDYNLFVSGGVLQGVTIDY